MISEALQLDWGCTRIRVGIDCHRELSNVFPSARCEDNSIIPIICGEKSVKESGLLASIQKQLKGKNIIVIEGIRSNPDFQRCQQIVDKLRGYGKLRGVIAIGGGSVIDTAKISDLAVRLNCSVEHLIENTFDRENIITTRPLVAIPTTAGTGSEVTPFATIWNFGKKRKFSIDTGLIQPTHAFVDARFSLSMPEILTIETAGDALGHAMDSIWSKLATPTSKNMSAQAIHLIYASLPNLLQNLSAIDLRQAISWASTLAGMAISITRTSLAHAISYPLTLRFGIPHGRAVATLLPFVFNYNLSALDHDTVKLLCWALKCETVSTLLGTFTSFMKQTGLVKSLRLYGVQRSDISTIVADCFSSNRFDNNLKRPTSYEIVNILKMAID